MSSEAAKQRYRERKERNPERLREYAKRYRERNPERLREKAKRYRERNREQINEHRRRYRQHHGRGQRTAERVRRYGLTGGDYDRMLAEQGGVCAICLCVETVKSHHGNPFRLGIDHDHLCCPGKESCGRCVMWLACNRCNNRRLGDDTRVLTRLIRMLEYHRQGVRYVDMDLENELTEA